MVSSTVPRLELRCPPVRETLSSTQLRTASASCLSWTRSNWRRTEGSWTVGSSGAMEEVLSLSVAVHDHVGQRAQRAGVGQRAAVERIERLGQQLARPCVGTV